MKPIKYSPDVADKLRILKKTITMQYGKHKAQQIVSMITKAIRNLSNHEKMGISVEEVFGVKTDYRYFFVLKNYVFYRISDKYIYVVNIYNEREDFMRQLFGIDTITQETLDYWKE